MQKCLNGIWEKQNDWMCQHNNFLFRMLKASAFQFEELTFWNEEKSGKFPFTLSWAKKKKKKEIKS